MKEELNLFLNPVVKQKVRTVFIYKVDLPCCRKREIKARITTIWQK